MPIPDHEALLPKPLMKAPHIAPFDPIIRNYIGNDSDLTGQEVVWFYATILNIDTVPSAMLPYLAEMFGVDGFKGFDFAPTDALKRQTLKDAILMKRKHGTKWALRKALEHAGFLNVVIFDHLNVNLWNGQYLWDGSILWNSDHWAHFRIEMEPPLGVQPNQVNMAQVWQIVNYWKRHVTLCVDITIKQIVITSFGVSYGNVPLWDGTLLWNGNDQWS